MVVYNRIKIISINSDNTQEIEEKVNTFFQQEPDICELTNIEYYLEYRLVVLEYITHRPECFYTLEQKNSLAKKMSDRNDNPPVGKPEKPGKCKTKVQLTVNNTVIDEVYTATLGDESLEKTADAESTVFMFNFGKKTKVIKNLKAKPEVEVVNCPAVGETLTGDINGNPISVTIMSEKKPTKYAIDLPVEGEDVVTPEPEA